MKTRKQGSTELFQFGPYTDENGTADFTGSTLKLTMRNQYGAIVINAATATPGPGGTGTYAPSAGDVANFGLCQIEVTETKASGKIVVYPQSGYDLLNIEPVLTATGVAPPNPTNNSITLAMMQQQTPGAVLLYDASGTAIAYAPGTAGKVLTSNGAGLPPTWQTAGGGIPVTGTAGSVLIYDAAGAAAVLAPATAGRVLTANGAGLAPSFQAPAPSFTNSGVTAGRAWIPILIQEQALAGATYTTPTWAAGTYRTIWIELDVSSTGFSYVKLRVNADSGNNYNDQLANWLNTAAVGDPSFGANGYAKVGILGNGNPDRCHHDIYFNPLTTGRQRFGRTGPNLGSSGVNATSYTTVGAFEWTNTATDVTSLTVFADLTMTGKISVWGVPA